MRSLRVIMLATGLVSASIVPAMAAIAPSCQKATLDPAATPAQAAVLMKKALPQGVTLGSGEMTQIIASYEQAVSENPAYAAQLASIVAAARPDMLDSLHQSISLLCPESAKTIIDQVEQAASNPSADQLAAIAQSEGSAPAAGADDGGDTDGSAQ